MSEIIKDPRYRMIQTLLQGLNSRMDALIRVVQLATGGGDGDEESDWDSFEIGPWNLDRISDTRVYKAYIRVDDQAIVMTGADVETQLVIPFPHKWLRTDFYHTDAAFAASMDALYLSIQRPAGTVPGLDVFIEYLIDKYDITDAEFGENWGENFEYEDCEWVVILNTTATDLVYPIFYLERIGK